MNQIEYKRADAFKYQLVKGFHVQTGIKGAAARITNFIELDQDGMLRIFAGYAWDGASGPTIDTKNSMRASLIHDALYQLMREGKLGQEWRDEADKLLHDICVKDGMWSVRAKAWLIAVWKFAAYAAKRRVEQTFLAP